ncbi:dTMP kinase, partial [Streptomyces sp. NPDC002596]
EAAAAAEAARAEAAASASVPDNELTVPTPVVSPNEVTQPVPSPVDTPSDQAETAMIPRITDPSERPAVRDATGPADETAVLPPVRDVGDEQPADRVPRGIFRDERPADAVPEGENERTRELPQISDPHAVPEAAEDRRPGRGRRRRPEWAEETPLDDLPTLADELLGGHDRDDEGRGTSGRGRRPRR